jgi:hypothetical protein
MRTITKSALALGVLGLALYLGPYTVRAQGTLDESARVLLLVNQRRAAEGVAPLQSSAALAKAAQAWAKSMAATSYLSHKGIDGSTPADRIAAAGYRGAGVGENLARGFNTATAVVDAWMNSAGHRANILKPDFTDAGVGMAVGRAGTYWVIDFGASGAASSQAPVVLPPIIAAILPNFARMGDVVTFQGDRFGEKPGSVTFAGGQKGSLIAWSDREIVVTVPFGAMTGMAFVQTEGGATAGAHFYPLPPLGTEPLVLKIDPASARVGSTVRISGRNFGMTPGTVTIGDIPARVVGWSTAGYAVDVIVPAGAVAGPVIVTRSDGAPSNAFRFTVAGASSAAPNSSAPASQSSRPAADPVFTTPPAPRLPVLASIDPRTGRAGDTVLLTGTWFNAPPRRVTFNGVPAQILRWDEASIAVTVPTGATTGLVEVRTDAGLSNGITFVVALPTAAPSTRPSTPAAGPVLPARTVPIRRATARG